MYAPGRSRARDADANALFAFLLVLDGDEAVLADRDGHAGLHGLEKFLAFRRQTK